MYKTVANAQYNIIFGDVGSSKLIEFLDKILVDLVKMMESAYEIHGVAFDDLAKVVEFEYEIHGKACDDLVEAVGPKYDIQNKACDNMASDEIQDKASGNVVKAVESRDP